MGDDGLIKRAEQASQHQANAEASENEAMGVLDKYIEDASKVEKEPGLQIKSVAEDIGTNAKVIKLSYSIGTGEVATAEQIEAKIEEMHGIAITDEQRNEAKKEANTIGISYEEYMLELIASIELEMEVTGDLRAGLQEQATSVGMTYKEFLEYALTEECGIIFGEYLVSVEDLEEMCKEELGIEITDETRESIKTEATNAGMTYREYLEYALNFYGVDISGVITEITIGNTKVMSTSMEFIATRNGTYTIKAVANNGMQSETQIEVTGIEEEKFSNLYETTTTYTDVNGDTATIPAGFAVGTSSNVNTIANGLVITDAVDSEGYSIGNEFVWIPVASDETFIRESFTDTALDTSAYIEPYESGYTDGKGTQEIAEYNTMREKVLEHNGFYIGRYEAGVDTIIRRTNESEVQEVVVKRGVAPYSHVTWGDSITEIGTEGAVYLSKNMYADLSSVTSTLCYGVQWDAMTRYIGDIETSGIQTIVEYPFLTGITKNAQAKNIYDMIGNCYEWTMETFKNDYGISKVIRNSYMNRESRGANDHGDAEHAFGFRCALYIN